MIVHVTFAVAPSVTWFPPVTGTGLFAASTHVHALGV